MRPGWNSTTQRWATGLPASSNSGAPVKLYTSVSKALATSAQARSAILRHQLFPHHIEVRGHPADHLHAQGDFGGDGDQISPPSGATHPRWWRPQARRFGPPPLLEIPRPSAQPCPIPTWGQTRSTPRGPSTRPCRPAEGRLERRKILLTRCKSPGSGCFDLLRAGQQRLECPPVRCEADPAVHVQPQIGPHFPHRFDFPLFSSTRWQTKAINLESPAKIRTSSFMVASAMASTLDVQSSIKAMDLSGVLRASHQGGRWLTMMALKSPLTA